MYTNSKRYNHFWHRVSSLLEMGWGDIHLCVRMHANIQVCMHACALNACMCTHACTHAHTHTHTHTHTCMRVGACVHMRVCVGRESERQSPKSWLMKNKNLGWEYSNDLVNPILPNTTKKNSPPPTGWKVINNSCFVLLSSTLRHGENVSACLATHDG